MHFRPSRVFLISLVLLGALPTGCNRAEVAEAERVKAELAATQQKLSAAEKALAAKEDKLALAAAAAGTGQKQTAEKEQALAEKDAQIRALQAEIAALRKGDAFVYAEASAMQLKGVPAITLDRYQQFLKAFPKSPLAADANRAIADISTLQDREARFRASMVDPKRGEQEKTREILQRFGDGIVSVAEIAPLLKGRTVAEVVKLLGSPNKTYRNGAELGYVDKVIDTATGNKETLVIGFEAGSVVTLRAGYQGRPLKP